MNPFFVAFLNCDSAQPRQCFESFWQSQQFRVESSGFTNAVLRNGSKVSNSALLSPLYHPTQSFKTQPAALPQPTEPVVLLRMPGTAGAAETGVVRAGAKSGVNDQLAIGKLRLVHAFWWHINILLRVFSDPHFSRGAHRVDAGVSVTGVGALIRRLYVIQD